MCIALINIKPSFIPLSVKTFLNVRSDIYKLPSGWCIEPKFFSV